MFVRISKSTVVNTDHITVIGYEKDEDLNEYPCKVSVLDYRNTLFTVEEPYQEGFAEALRACNSAVLVASRAVREYDSPGWFLK